MRARIRFYRRIDAPMTVATPPDTGETHVTPKHLYAAAFLVGAAAFTAAHHTWTAVILVALILIVVCADAICHAVTPPKPRDTP